MLELWIIFTIMITLSCFCEASQEQFYLRRTFSASQTVELYGTLSSMITSVWSSPTNDVYGGVLDGVEKISSESRIVSELYSGGRYIYGITGDGAGNIYISEATDCRIRKISSTGAVAVVLGTGDCVQSPDGSTVSPSRTMTNPHALHLDTRSGMLYFTEYSRDVVRCFSTVDDNPTLSTYVGSVNSGVDRGFSGDGGPATSALLSHPRSLYMDSSSNLFIADIGNSRLRRVLHSTGIITSLFNQMYAGIVSLVVDRSGLVYSTGSGNAFVLKSNYTSGVVQVFAGTGENNGNSPVGLPPLQTAIEWNSLLAMGNDGTILYMAMMASRRVLSLALVDDIASPAPTVAPSSSPPLGNCPSFSSSGAGEEVFCSFSTCGSFTLTATTCFSAFTGDTMLTLYSPSGESLVSNDDDPNGLCSTISAFSVTSQTCGTYSIGQRCSSSMACSGTTLYRITPTTLQSRKPTAQPTLRPTHAPTTATPTTAPTPSGVTPGSVALYGTMSSMITSVWSSSSDDVYTGVADAVEKISHSSKAVTSVTSGRYVFGITGDNAGNIYIAEAADCWIRRVSATGVVSTLVGTGYCGQYPDGSPVSPSTMLNTPHALYLDVNTGWLYFTEYNHDVVRRFSVQSSNAFIHTYAGSATGSLPRGFGGDGGPATEALLSHPRSLSMDKSGNLFIADIGNSRIRRVAASTGIITSMVHPLFSGIVSLVVDGSGFVYSTSSVNAYVARTNFDAEVVDTFAGTGENNGDAEVGKPPLSTPIEWNSLLAMSGDGKTLFMAMQTARRVLSVSVIQPKNGAGDSSSGSESLSSWTIAMIAAITVIVLVSVGAVVLRFTRNAYAAVDVNEPVPATVQFTSTPIAKVVTAELGDDQSDSDSSSGSIEMSVRHTPTATMSSAPVYPFSFTGPSVNVDGYPSARAAGYIAVNNRGDEYPVI